MTLSFYRWLNSDYPNFMNNKIEVFNGSSWVNIWQQPSNNTMINDTSWVLQAFNITAHKNSAFQFRIGHSVNSAGAFLVSGWNVDDVSILDQSSAAVPLPGALPLFAAGLGLVGLVARRKRRQAAAAAA